MYTEKELIHEVSNWLKETKKYLEAVKKSTENNQVFFFKFTELEWLIVESGYIEECIRNLYKKSVPGIESFIKTNIKVFKNLNAKSKEFIIKSPWTNYWEDDSGSRVEILTTMMISLTLSLEKLYFLHVFKGINAEIGHLDEDKDSLILLNSLYEILRASPAQKHHPLLEQILEGFSILSYIPKDSELKFLVDLGFTSIKLLKQSGIETIDFRAHPSDKPDSNYVLSYKSLARDFYQLSLSWLMISNNHIIGIRFSPNMGDIGIPIPQSINLLTKLKILIIDNESLIHEYKKFLPFDKLPNQITSLNNLRILYIINSELNEFPKEFTQLSHLRYLYILDSQLHTVPNFTTMFPKLRELRLEVGFLKKTPDWLFEFARKHYSRRYIQNGVSKEDAAVLGLLEILSRPLEHAEYNLECDLWVCFGHCGYSINKLGRVTDLKLGLWTQSSRNPPFILLPCFPEEICQLRQLENLYICNGTYSEEYGFFPPHYKEKADAWIPESIRDLKSLRYLCTNAKYTKSLKPFLESLEKFETDVFEP